jgi:AAA domain
MEIRKAQRMKAKLRLGIAAPSGAGKTYSALLMAFGLGGKIGLIDTEHGSGHLYAHLGEYDVITIEAPYTVAKYTQAIKTFEDAGYGTIIIDSLSHAWAGDGGLLDKQGKMADRGDNSYAAWRKITPEHNALVDAMLQSPSHIIATMRSKQDYVLEVNDKGKQTPKKVGMAPVQRDGMEYEFTVMLDVDMNHVATSSKDRTGLFDGRFFKISKETGRELLAWLETGEAGPDVEAIVNGIRNSSTLEILRSSYEAAMQMLPSVHRPKIVAAKDERKAELTTQKETS